MNHKEGKNQIKKPQEPTFLVRTGNEEWKSFNEINNPSTKQNNKSHKNNQYKENYKLPTNNPSKISWKKIIGIGALSFGIGLGIYSFITNNNETNKTTQEKTTTNSKNWKKEYTIQIPEPKHQRLQDSIKTIKLNDSIDYLVMHHDKLLKELARDTNIVNIEKLSVDTNILRATRDAYEQIPLEKFTEAGNLGGQLNIYTYKGKGNTDKAMINMWSDKKLKLNKKYKTKYDSFVESKIKEYQQTAKKTSSLNEFREFIKTTTNQFKNNFDIEQYKQDKFTNKKGIQNNEQKELSKLVNNIYCNINADIIMTIGQTEYYGNINPVVNLVNLDKLLKENSKIPWDIPANGDNFLSYGYPQLTSFVVNDKKNSPIALNKYLPVNKRVPTTMVEYNNKPEYQIKAALLNIVTNATILGKKLSNRGVLTEFNQMYDALNPKQQETLIISLISTMNNNPNAVAKGVARYVKQYNQKKEIASNIFTKIDFKNDRVNKYFNKSLKNYLIVKNWD